MGGKSLKRSWSAADIEKILKEEKKKEQKKNKAKKLSEVFVE